IPTPITTILIEERSSDRRAAHGPLFCCRFRCAPVATAERCGRRSIKSSRSRRIAAKTCWLLAKTGQAQTWEKKLSYKMIAERDNEKVKIERQSSLIIVAKARVFASAGWQVMITDKEGKSYTPAEFDRLLAA